MASVTTISRLGPTCGLNTSAGTTSSPRRKVDAVTPLRIALAAGANGTIPTITASFALGDLGAVRHRAGTLRMYARRQIALDRRGSRHRQAEWQGHAKQQQRSSAVSTVAETKIANILTRS